MLKPPTVIFIGGLPTLRGRKRNPAYSPAGESFQRGLLRGLMEAGARISCVFSVQPRPIFPRGRALFALGGSQREPNTIPIRQLGFVNIAGIKQLTSAFALVPRLLAALWRERRNPQRTIVQYNLANPPALAALLVARLTRTRIFAIVADLPVPGDGERPDTLLRRIEFQLQVRSMSRFDGLVVLTRRAAHDFAPTVPVLELHGGLADDLGVGQSEPEVSTTPDGYFTLMYSGTLSPAKGIDVMLEAFARLRGNQYRLWITGDGPYEAIVRAAAARDPRVRYWGLLPRNEMLALSRRATALMNPQSLKNPTASYAFPSKLLEYLAIGRPVLSTFSASEARELYGDLVIPIEGEGPEAIVAAVEQLQAMSPQRRAELGAEARRWVFENVTWRVQAARVASFLAAPESSLLEPSGERAPLRVSA
jgi:glycosyltransferase involved in cell wall biosynthesis